MQRDLAPNFRPHTMRIVAKGVDRGVYVAPTVPTGNEEYGEYEPKIDKDTGRLLVNTDRRTSQDFDISLSTGATYASGDVIGGLKTVTTCDARNGAVIESIVLIDGDQVKAPIDVLIMGNIPGSGFTDNDPVALPAASRRQVCGIIRFLAADYIDLSTGYSIASKHLPLSVRSLDTSGRFTFACIARGAAAYTGSGGPGKGLVLNMVMRSV